MKVAYVLDENLAREEAKKMRLEQNGNQNSQMQNLNPRGQGGMGRPGPAGPPAKVLTSSLPREHEFTFQPPNKQQLLAIISKTNDLEHTEVRRLEGTVAKRAQLKPPRNKIYDKFKSARIQKTNTPKMSLKQTTIR